MNSPTLRHDQIAMVADTDAALRAGAPGVLCIGPTGFGKGEVIRHWLHLAATRQRRAFFVVHLAEIAFDIRGRLAAAGVSSRVLAGGADEGPADAAVTIGTWQTAVARDLTLDVHLLVADEAHRAKAATFLGVLERHRGARLLGFTATGQRGDGSGLGECGFTQIVAGPQVAELVADGHLAPCRVLAPDAFVEELADDPAAAYLAHGAGRPAIIYGGSIPHSRAIAAALTAAGVRALHVDSDVPARQRAAALAALEAGDIDVLCNFRLFVEGINVRRVSCIVLASAFGHDGPYLQAIGRGRRTCEGKADCLIIDLRGNIHRRGHPDAERTYSLDGAGCRLATALTAVSQCRACLGWAPPARVCPSCGAALPPPKPPRITKRALREQRLARVVRAGSLWDLWVSLVLQGRARGYKPQWAALQYRAQTGGFPRFTAAMVPEQMERAS
jgi:superfamily II DNA or RNA helicase